jgi:glycosyltransferase involved in cell wall biosynthesis
MLFGYSSRLMTVEGNERPRVLVLQVGARLHYAVPAVYARAGALQSLYTDACASLGLLGVARRIIPTAYRGPGVRRLLGRVLPEDIHPNLVRVETLATLTERARLRLARRQDVVLSTHERLRRRILRDGFGAANCIYALDNGDLDLLKAARDAGLAIVYEQIICPSVGRIMREERHLFAGIEAQDDQPLVEEGIARDVEIFRMADTVICASDFSRDDVLSLSDPSVRAVAIPYGIHQDWLDTTPSPVPGRVLFVGTVGLRKGNHYLAEATRLLKARGVPCDVRVVGPYDPEVIARPEFQGPTYVGQVPRDVVRSEFARADVFALPTVADGFAIVHLEAMSFGVPVITTPNCGSQVRNEIDGFVVPIRDPRALAERIEQIVTDRTVRDRLSVAAKKRAEELSWGLFGERLLSATQEALDHASRAQTPTLR